MKPERKQLGGQLVQRGFITPAQLDFALREQAARRRLGEPSVRTQLGNVLCGLAFLSHADLALVLAESGGDAATPVDLPAQLCRQLSVLSQGMVGGELRVSALRPLAPGSEALLLAAVRNQGVLADSVAVSVVADTAGLLAGLAELTVDPGQVDMLAAALDKDPDNGPVSDLLSALQVDAVQQRASDIYLTASGRPGVVTYRVDGELLHRVHLSPRAGRRLITLIKQQAGLDAGKRYESQDGSASFVHHGREIGLRVATQPVLSDGETVTLRVQDPAALRGVRAAMGVHVPVADGLLRAVSAEGFGMLLVSGTTGAGKTSTLYGLLRDYDRVGRRCISIEDPIEQELREVVQTPVREGLGQDFAYSVRSAMRQSPDFLVVGETRDPQTALAVLSAAETGHPVATTIHAGNVPQTLVRYLALLPNENRQAGLTSLAMTLSGIVSQRLVKKLCACAKPVLAGANALDIAPDAVVKEPCGCGACKGTGYLGRVVVPEALFFTEKSREALRDALLDNGMSGMSGITRIPGTTYYSVQDAATALVRHGLIPLAAGLQLCE